MKLILGNVENVRKSFKELQDYGHQINVHNGWWSGDPDKDFVYAEKHFAQSMMLVVTEISEAVEAYRDLGTNRINQPVFEDGKPVGVDSELADAVIRIMDYAQVLQIDLIDAILAKLLYNKYREFRHGGKRI